MLARHHPLLDYELHTGNELTKPDTARSRHRGTGDPPAAATPGGQASRPIRVALYAGTRSRIRRYEDIQAGKSAWIAPDDALPDHPSVVWRRRNYPKVVPRVPGQQHPHRDGVGGRGMGVGILPVFLAQPRKDLVALTEILDECQTELWLLTHPESRPSTPGFHGVPASFGTVASLKTLSKPMHPLGGVVRRRTARIADLRKKRQVLSHGALCALPGQMPTTHRLGQMSPTASRSIRPANTGTEQLSSPLQPVGQLRPAQTQQAAAAERLPSQDCTASCKSRASSRAGPARARPACRAGVRADWQRPPLRRCRCGLPCPPARPVRTRPARPPRPAPRRGTCGGRRSRRPLPRR